MADDTSNNNTLINKLSILIPSFGGCEYCVHCSKLKVKPTDNGDETINLPIDLEIESQLNMLEAEVNGKSVGDEELDVDLEVNEIASDIATSNDTAVTEIICDAEMSIHLDSLPTNEANLGQVSIAKVSSPNIL